MYQRVRTIKNGFRTLVRTRADVNCQDVEGKTALQLAEERKWCQDILTTSKLGKFLMVR